MGHCVGIMTQDRPRVREPCCQTGLWVILHDRILLMLRITACPGFIRYQESFVIVCVSLACGGMHTRSTKPWCELIKGTIRSGQLPEPLGYNTDSRPVGHNKEKII